MTYYEVLQVKSLNQFNFRGLRMDIVEKLENRIKEKGYNPSKPLTVVEKNGKYIIVDGYHRKQALNKLGIKEVPCLVYKGENIDLYSLAVQSNQDEDTYAPLDLFDWLDIIKQLRNKNYTQEEIGKKIKWSRSKVNNYLMLLDKIDTNILNLAKTHQEGRVSKNDTMVSFNFTERWFRDSGLYDLCEDYQLRFMKSLIKDRCIWSKSKIQKETAMYKRWAKFYDTARSELYNSADLSKLVRVIENDVFKTLAQLRRKIEDLNRKAKNKLICGDALVELENIEDSSIDVVITDPPYGIDYTSNRSQYSERTTKEKTIGDENIDEALKVLDSACKILGRKTKNDAHIYIFTSWKVYPMFMKIISKYFEIKNLIIWDKMNHGPGDLEYSWGNRYEMIIFATKGNKGLNRRKDDIISVPKIPSDSLLCPTQKPVDVIKELLDVSAQEADVICDPFMGVGTTIKALKEMKNKNLTYIGIEINKKLFEIAKAYIGNKK